MSVCRLRDAQIRTSTAPLLCKSLIHAPVFFGLWANQPNALAKVCERVCEMTTVWGALISFLFVLATALSGHVETPSKEQVEQMEKAQKEIKEQIEKAEKEKKEQMEKAGKEKKGQKEKAEQKEKPKQKGPDA